MSKTGTTADLIIYGDNKIEVEWFRTLSSKLSRASYTKIGSRGSNSRIIERFITYDRPDIILLAAGRPVLVLEKTREVPTGHNVGQRVARLVRAAELSVPVIKFFPFDARKHGDYTSICNLNIRLLQAFTRMTEIHGVPILAINWPADRHGELIDDDSENERASAVVDDYIRSGFDPGCAEITHQLAMMKSEYETRLERYPLYAKMPGSSVSLVNTPELLRQLAGLLDPEEKTLIGAKARSLVYRIEMTPDKCRREDPYTGTQFIYDYIWCRSGPRTKDKHTNLVLHFPLINRDRWFASNPNEPGRKSCNWYLTASALWFQDGIHVLR